MKKTILYASLCLTLGLASCQVKKLLKIGMQTSTMQTVKAQNPDNQTGVAVEVVKDDSINGIPREEKLKKVESYVVTLPFVAFYKKDFVCYPGQKSFANLPDNLQTYMSDEIATYANKPAAGKYKLRLHIEDCNFNFEYKNKGSIIVALIVTFRTKKEFVSPLAFSMKVGYELLKDDQVIQKGSFTRERKVDEQISANVPIFIPNTRYYSNDPHSPYYRSPGQRSVDADYAQLQGGTAPESIHAMKYGFAVYEELIDGITKDIMAAVGPSLK